MTDSSFKTALPLIKSGKFIPRSTYLACTDYCLGCPFANTQTCSFEGLTLTSQQSSLLREYYPEFYI